MINDLKNYSCIVKDAFINSGCKRLIITGLDGCGKTTLCSELYKTFDVLRSVGYWNDKLTDVEFIDNYQVIERFQIIDTLATNDYQGSDDYWKYIEQVVKPIYNNSMFLIFLNTFNEKKIKELGISQEKLRNNYITLYTKFKEIVKCQLKFLQMPMFNYI